MKQAAGGASRDGSEVQDLTAAFERLVAQLEATAHALDEVLAAPRDVLAGRTGRGDGPDASAD